MLVNSSFPNYDLLFTQLNEIRDELQRRKQLTDDLKRKFFIIHMELLRSI